MVKVILFPSLLFCFIIDAHSYFNTIYRNQYINKRGNEKKTERPNTLDPLRINLTYVNGNYISTRSYIYPLTVTPTHYVKRIPPVEKSCIFHIQSSQFVYAHCICFNMVDL